MRHLLRVADLTTAEIERIFAITEDLKTKYAQGLREALLPGRVMGMLFEKPSLRTRVSFEAGMMQPGRRQPVSGRRRRLRRARKRAPILAACSANMSTCIVVRANRHQTVVELAQHCTCPVINGLTDYAHPCQALADLYTLQELVGRLNGHDAGLRRRRQQRGPQPGRRLRQGWA